MKTGRRSFLSGIAVLLSGTRALLAGAQHQGGPRPFPPIPDGTASGRTPDDASQPPLADPKVKLEENQKTLRHDAERLLQLAQNLKDEVDKTQETNVLSLSLVKRAEEIEKLARQIKDLIRSA